MQGTDLTALDLVLANAALAVGAAVQGSIGFGLALIAAPMLLLIDPMLVPGPVILSSLLLTVLMTLRDRAHIDLHGIGWAVVGRVPGTALGAAAVALLPATPMALCFAAVVLAAVMMSAGGWRLAVSVPSLLGTGALSGFMGTATSIGGPPMALLWQDHAGPRLRGTLAGYFMVGTLMSIAALALADRFGVAESAASFALTPGIVLGYAISARIAPAMDGGYTRPAILGLSTLSALAVIARAVL